MLGSITAAAGRRVPNIWMKEALPRIGNLTLQQITIPGTHDSASYSVTDQLFDIPQFLEEIIKVADLLHLPVGQIIDGWAKSQDNDLYTQFLDGIRYVDLRVVWDTQSNSWKSHHGDVIGTSVEILLQQTQKFVSSYPSEVLVMEFSHSTVTSTPQQDQILFNLITTYLGKNLWPPQNGFKTINEMINSGKNIFLTLTLDNLPSNIWNGNTIINSFANSTDLGTMESYNLMQIESWEKHGIYPNQIYKMSWTLTPTSTTILEMLIPGKPTNLIEFANIANNDLASWFQREVEVKSYNYPIFSNILIIDHYASSPIVDIVQRGLNVTKKN